MDMLRNCVYCKRKLAQERRLPFAQMPDARLLEPGESVSAQIFRNVAIDFAGPYHVGQFVSNRLRKKKIKEDGPDEYIRHTEKRWIIIFVCSKIRAVHLEMTRGEGAEQFICALQRFIARRGTPAVIHCDNGPGIVKAEKALTCAWENTAVCMRRHFANIEFVFTPAKAPNFNGQVERLVQSAKRALRTFLINAPLTDDSFETGLCQVEAMLNSRPLAIRFVGDSDEPLPLSPDHFLSSRLYHCLPEIPGATLARRYQQKEEALRMAWYRFMQDCLPERHKITGRKGKSYNLEPGDIVCDISDKMNKTPLGHWPLGIVLKVTPSADKVVRRVFMLKSRTHNVVERKAAHLVRIECLDEESKERLRKRKLLFTSNFDLTPEQYAEIRREAAENQRKHETFVAKLRRREAERLRHEHLDTHKDLANAIMPPDAPSNAVAPRRRGRPRKFIDVTDSEPVKWSSGTTSKLALLRDGLLPRSDDLVADLIKTAIPDEGQPCLTQPTAAALTKPTPSADAAAIESLCRGLVEMCISKVGKRRVGRPRRVQQRQQCVQPPEVGLRRSQRRFHELAGAYNSEFPPFSEEFSDGLFYARAEAEFREHFSLHPESSVEGEPSNEADASVSDSD
jgi:hypothetical protein